MTLYESGITYEEWCELPSTKEKMKILMDSYNEYLEEKKKKIQFELFGETHVHNMS
jgi:hypothetical protein